MDANEVTQAPDTRDLQEGNLQKLEGAVSWEIATKRSPELEDILTPASLFYLAEGTLQANEKKGMSRLHGFTTGKRRGAGCLDPLKNRLVP